MSEIPFSVRSRRTGASNVNDLGGMNFSTLNNNELLKRVDADNVGGSSITATETSVGGSYNHKIKTFVGSNELASITTAYNSIGNYKNIQFLPDDSIVGADGINIQSVPSSTETRVGINVPDPEEALDIEGNLELRGGAGKIFFKHPSGLQKVELDGDQDGTNGGKFIVKTKVDNGSMTEKLTVNNVGAIGLGATPDFGATGNFLMSKGTGQSPEWFVPTTGIITSVKKIEPQTFTSGQTIKITGWETPHVDIGTTGWSGANSRYTIQRQGTYRIDLKAIISNTFNDTSSLRYLLVGLYIYNSNGTLAFDDLDTTILYNVDSGGGNAERGSADYTIIRTLSPDQYIELQVTSQQAGTGDYIVESAVFNIEELGASHVAGVGQFFTLADGNALQTKVNNLNIRLNVCADTDLKVGNANTGNVNSNTLNAWLPLYTQTNLIRLQQQIVLTDPSRPVKIETNVSVLLNITHVGFRVVCNNGISVLVVPGTTNWKSSAATGDDDTPAYCASVVHAPGGTGNLTYTIEAYVLARNPPNPAIAIFNPSLDPSIALAQCTMLLTEL
jgi:hypothetical protein